MADLILRGRFTEAGMIELLDPIPEDFDRSQEVKVIFGQTPDVYESTNDYGEPVLVDEVNGIVTPLNPLTREEFLNSPIIGLWEDRREEIGDINT